MTKICLLLVTVLVGVALAGCGGSKKELTTTTTAATQPETTAVRVYFLLRGKLQPVRRTVSETNDVPVAALAALVEGPTTAEREGLGLTSVVQEAEGVTVSGSVAHVRGLDSASLAQIVYTLTQFSSVKAVEMDSRRYTRKDFEDETPVILVESPLSDQSVARPFRVTGTANTFEATFQYELVDSARKVIAHHYVTATSGSGTRGTFDVTVPYSAGHAGVGRLIVYESSAKDGSRIHVVAIPLRLTG